MNRLVPTLLLLLAALPTGCGTTTTCGDGTVNIDGKCVPDPNAPTCGDGTSLADGQCVAADAGTADSAAPDAAEPDSGPDLDVSAADLDAQADAPDVAEVEDTVAPDACQPNCINRTCGDDGCGGSCGSCGDPAKPICDPLLGQCKAGCVPQCKGKNCGDDTCGGTCGACQGSDVCSSVGVCVPPAWTCEPTAYGEGFSCDCKCGAPDPDCQSATLPLWGCGDKETCDSSGKCVSSVPAAWTCAAVSYAGVDFCDCGCGAPDPDCAFGLPVHGCKSDAASCDASGKCLECVPNCTGKACGDDGCGGFCGFCADSVKTTCDASGQCVDPCAGPKPLTCLTATCGDDGCGGTCGACATGSECISGQCQKMGSLDSCVGHCGSTAPSGCYCMKGCEASGTCCADFGATCTCKPNCTGKACGDDGCGGTCGVCPSNTPYCGATGQCTATCTPKCSGKTCGDDGCGGACGTCASGSACAYTSQCVPNAWKCDLSYFGDKGACDCGCGAIDPDCASGKLSSDGCPGSGTCSASGYCNATFCDTDGDCNGKWCTGAWPKSAGLYSGVCGDLFPTGGAAGTPCMIAEECGWGLCLKEACRTHCSTDAECGPGWLCEGLPVVNAATGSTWGFAGACMQPYGSAKTCTKQSDCSPAGETCVARVDPVTLGPRYVCEAVPAAPGAGASCTSSECPEWQICIDTPKGKKCALPCPGGVGDCPNGWTCVDKPLHNAGTPDPSDDPKVPTCQPN